MESTPPCSGSSQILSSQKMLTTMHTFGLAIPPSLSHNPLSLTPASSNFLPNKLFVSKSLSQALLPGEPKLRQTTVAKIRKQGPVQFGMRAWKVLEASLFCLCVKVPSRLLRVWSECQQPDHRGHHVPGEERGSIL